MFVLKPFIDIYKKPAQLRARMQETHQRELLKGAWFFPPHWMNASQNFTFSLL